MEMQYLASCDVVWKSSGSDLAPKAKPAARGGSTGGAGATGASSLSVLPLDSLAAAAASHAAAPAPAAAAAAACPDAVGGPGSATNVDFSDIANWDYRRGYFPLTDAALPQMLFPEDLARPRHYFAAGILLYMRDLRTPEEEAAFQRLNSAWQGWFLGEGITYDALSKGPPKAPPRYAYTQTTTLTRR